MDPIGISRFPGEVLDTGCVGEKKKRRVYSAFARVPKGCRSDRLPPPPTSRWVPQSVNNLEHCALVLNTNASVITNNNVNTGRRSWDRWVPSRHPNSQEHRTKWASTTPARS